MLKCHQIWHNIWPKKMNKSLLQLDYLLENSFFRTDSNFIWIYIFFFLLQVIALKVKRNGEWKTWTYERYVREVELAARGFIHVGMSRHRSVAIIGQNSPEWVISDLAAIFSGKWPNSWFFLFFFQICKCFLIGMVKLSLNISNIKQGIVRCNYPIMSFFLKIRVHIIFKL